uniref:MAP kinase-activated protein kinase 5 isoform X1 n=1 Tax=Petromyzon marinus TaxID=7757 RepID=A0AAJ7WNT1_PETMA|nr:MAP kinase-activated protein kinase 5 isoform X1 [Petromyzon marinus]XP_032803303.1 MAP kinase-activated protein kinase 5 isoform X1 [Petromyzon marinus]XP_032803304.1 MAP kinase-activated protein kinase 5 isoform X1 [Petromyzon marinus]XP_032803305.1 MAP kinase-activated protein kinase 5 isoform X1 [Petromyzon marinus]
MSGDDADGSIKHTPILDDYTIVWNQKLGSGISGPVRPCVKKATGERFALKILPDRPKARNEIKLHLQCCGHPNVVKVHEVFANSMQLPHEAMPRARLLLVMEMMEGGELFNRISQCRHFTEKQASKVTQQVRGDTAGRSVAEERDPNLPPCLCVRDRVRVCSPQISRALQHCHSLNIAHRDLKPENLLFKDNSLDAPLKLCDFGFAKVDQGDLMTPQFTPYYVAPQVLEAQKQHRKEKSGVISPNATPYTYNKSCDLWSLGVIIYVMLCGYPPFHSEQRGRAMPRDMRRKIMQGKFHFPEEGWSQISEPAKDVVRCLLKVKAEERLSVEGVLAHRWLTSTEAMDNVLPSLHLLMDKVAMAELQQAHADALASMRMPELSVSLKPLTCVNNPILRKRKLLRTQLCEGSAGGAECPQGKEDSCSCPEGPSSGVPFPENPSTVALCPPDADRGASCPGGVEDVAVEKLRDVIAQCILPQGDEDEGGDEGVVRALHDAWSYNRDCRLLRDALHEASWNGMRFTEKVDRLHLAELLKQVIAEKTSQS